MICPIFLPPPRPQHSWPTILPTVLDALIAHTIKEAAKEIEKKKVLNGYCGYSFTGQTIDIKSAVECIHGAERMGYNQALTDAQKVLTEGTSQTK